MWLPIRIDEQRPEPLYYQIETQLRRLILGGQLPEGAQLPSIRELAVALKCSVITVRRVYQDLENEGVIRTRQGTGTFVAGVEPAARNERRLEQAAELLETAIDKALALQIMPDELRLLFEQALSRKAADKAAE